MNNLLSIYSGSFPTALSYMLQSVEYDPKAYLLWFYRTKNFSTVAHRRTLDRTKVAKAFLLFLSGGILIQIVIGLAMLVVGLVSSQFELTFFSTFVILLAPIVWAHLVVIPVVVARRFVINPRIKHMNNTAHKIFKNHTGTKIAVAGSFGKTTAKELLSTVLSEHMNVTSTPGNKNVSSAHYDFAQSLSGDEDVLIVEFGEGKPGDVEGFGNVLLPDLAFITGLAPAHLDQYGTVSEAAKDIFSLAKKVDSNNIFVNSESGFVGDYIETGQVKYSQHKVDGWEIDDISIDIHGTHFKMSKGKRNIHISSALIGRHLVGVMAAVAAIASRLGMSEKQIESGFKKTVPFEHRMQPYKLGGAWIIDDTYNGNMQGVRAGTELLASVPAKRKIYVTPGLVEQGKESDAIHEELGSIIAAANPDIVVLMSNSTTLHIECGLRKYGYDGDILVRSDPLQFYTGLDQFVAAGDVVLMQNDWTDNYV